MAISETIPILVVVAHWFAI